MAQTKEQKKKIIEDLKDKLSRQKALVFVNVKGLKVKELAELKKRLRAVDAQLRVAKKTLMYLALKANKLQINPKELPGQLALVFGFGDEMAAAKEAYQFSQVYPALQIVGGYLEGAMRSADEIMTLAKLPSRQELLVRAVRTIASPLSGLVNVLQENIKGLIYVLRAITPN